MVESKRKRERVRDRSCSVFEVIYNNNIFKNPTLHKTSLYKQQQLKSKLYVLRRHNQYTENEQNKHTHKFIESNLRVLYNIVGYTKCMWTVTLNPPPSKYKPQYRNNAFVKHNMRSNPTTIYISRQRCCKITLRNTLSFRIEPRNRNRLPQRPDLRTFLLRMQQCLSKRNQTYDDSLFVCHTWRLDARPGVPWRMNNRIVRQEILRLRIGICAAPPKWRELSVRFSCARKRRTIQHTTYEGNT